MQSLQGRVMTLQDIGSVKINNRDDLYDLLEVMNENFQECTIHLLLSNGADVDDELNSILDEGIINTCTLLCAENMLPEFGANANDCVGFLDKIMPVAKLLIQYILIKRISNAEPEPNLADFSTYSSLLSLKLYHNFPFYDELVAYKQGCLKELNAMKGEGISENYTLFSYINEQCCTAKVNEDDLKTFLTKKVLSKFNQYPYCKDLIIASLKKSCILEELCNEKIYTWQQISDCSLEKYKVNLNSDTIQALAIYLSESDMINLTLAYRECYEVSLESTEVLNGM
nr:uncharacterized protein LOC122272329 isoform X2 [Parasteatoda tepidariorum]XP_042911807.1 uncharacterized protein LOC122272329 isoform X2 [Parasteatoda tepidariorum]